MVKLVFPTATPWSTAATTALRSRPLSRSLAKRALAFSSGEALFDMSAPCVPGSSGSSPPTTRPVWRSCRHSAFATCWPPR